MAKRTITPPRTHSKVLWHFTGGPIWDNQKNIQGKQSRHPDVAYKALVSLLKSKELRVGNYHEIIKILVPRERYFDIDSKEIKERKNQVKELKTSAVCCVADIPISELTYHSHRYGKIGIGFHRDALIGHGFNPVLYTPYDSDIIYQFYQAQRALYLADESNIFDAAESMKDEIESEIQSIAENSETEFEFDINIDTSGIEYAVDEFKFEVDSALKQLEDSLAIIKTYHPKDFEDIYAEREWRSTNTFKFTMDDVAIILLPSSLDSNYFSKFTNTDLKSLKIPRSVSVLRWEDIF